MTPAQKATLAQLREVEVAFPPLWERETPSGSVTAMRMISYSGDLPPSEIEVDLVNILPDGRWKVVGSYTYRRR